MKSTTFQPRTEPIFQLSSPHGVAGYEWFAGPVGVSSPEAFFAEHEQGDVLDAHLLRRRYLETEEQRDIGFVTVNVEVRSLHSDAFWVVAMDHAAGMVIEVSERGFLYHTDILESRLAEWRAGGGMIAFDDFGVGSSRVLELGWVHPEIVKLDIEFTRHLTGRPSRYAVAVTSMLVTESRYVVAEGVNHPHEAGALEGMGVSLGQGWRFFDQLAELAS